MNNNLPSFTSSDEKDSDAFIEAATKLMRIAEAAEGLPGYGVTPNFLTELVRIIRQYQGNDMTTNSSQSQDNGHLESPSGAPKSTGDAETLEENFGHWLEQHGVILEQWEESKGFRAIIDLNKLKAAWLAHIDAAVKKQVAKITLAGMPELTLKQQDYITRELQGSDGKEEA